MTHFPAGMPPETAELTDDIRELFDDLAAALGLENLPYAGECHPSLDVLETERAIEIVVDVSGVPAGAIRVQFKGGVVIVAGAKMPPPQGAHTFHLVEREFGRFARAVRLTGAFDVARARATVRDGELTVVLPKLGERRGRPHRIDVTEGDPRA